MKITDIKQKLGIDDSLEAYVTALEDEAEGLLQIVRRVAGFFDETADAGSYDREVQLGARLLEIETELRDAALWRRT